jgi:hypothetical protein
MEFDEWFDKEGYAEEHRAVFRIVWEAAQDNAGEEPSLYLTPTERRDAQRNLTAAHRQLVDGIVGKPPAPKG